MLMDLFRGLFGKQEDSDPEPADPPSAPGRPQAPWGFPQPMDEFGNPYGVESGYPPMPMQQRTPVGQNNQTAPQKQKKGLFASLFSRHRMPESNRSSEPRMQQVGVDEWGNPLYRRVMSTPAQRQPYNQRGPQRPRSPQRQQRPPGPPYYF